MGFRSNDNNYCNYGFTNDIKLNNCYVLNDIHRIVYENHEVIQDNQNFYFNHFYIFYYDYISNINFNDDIFSHIEKDEKSFKYVEERHKKVLYIIYCSIKFTCIWITCLIMSYI